MKNEIEELVYEGHTCPGYYVNTQGELFSTRKAHLNRFGDLSLENVCYGSPMVKRTGSKQGKYILYRIGKIHTHRQYDGGYKDFGVQSHRALMETFKPFEENLPEELVDIWDSIPQIAKKYIKFSMQVDHIDPDNSKPTFHHLDNLQWLSGYENRKKGNR